MPKRRKNLSEKILAHARKLPEETVLTAKMYLHLGSRSAVDQALSRLAKRGKLERIARGVYIRMLQGRFGAITASPMAVLVNYAKSRGDHITITGASAANALGLSTQVPMRLVMLTSGPSRRFKFGKLVAELRHAPRWQVAFGYSKTSLAINVLGYEGPERSKETARKLCGKLSKEERAKLAEAIPILPGWMAPIVGKIAHAR